MPKRSRTSSSTAQDSSFFFWLDRAIALKALFLIGAVFLIYGFSLQGTWIGDDSWYISNNPLIHDPDRLWKAWFAPGSWVEFYPIEECVQWIQWQLWHNDTLGYHLTNVFLHIVSSFLVWCLLARFGLRLAWLGALLFAIHPEVVDSVSQIVELKNTLSLPPFLLAICLYIDYEKTKSGRCYLWALACFLFAMLCKITAAPFPVLILLYVWWKRGRVGWGDVKASLPFFMISLALGMTTIWAGEIYLRQFEYVVPDPGPLGGFLFRLALAGQILAFYFARCFWPIDPMPIYPKWTVDPSRVLQFLPWVVFGLAVLWLWTRRQTWGRNVLFGLGFFVVSLLPFLGFDAISYMQATWTLDHMLYIPIIGLIGLVVAGLDGMEAHLSPAIRPWGVGVLAVILSLLIFQSNFYARQFVDELTLARYNLRLDPGDGALHNSAGAALASKGDYAGAIEHFRIALQLHPNFAKAQFNLGKALLNTGKVPEAMAAFQQALLLQPDYGAVHVKMGDIFFQDGRFPEAIDQYRQAILQHQDTSLIHINLGTVFCLAGKPDEGIQQFKKAIALDPGSSLAKYNLAKTLCLTGHVAEGIEQYRQAIKLKPDYAEAHNNLGIVLYRQGNALEAQEQFQQALAANPNFADARNNLRLVERLQSNHPMDHK